MAFAAEAHLSTEAGASRSPWRGRVKAAIGRYVTLDYPKTSLLLSGTVERRLGEHWFAAFDVQVERPFEAHEDWRMPRLSFSLTHRWSKLLSAGLTASALGVDRWGLDGAVGRAFLFGDGGVQPWPWLTLRLRLGPVVYASQFRQLANGTEIPSAGFVERVSAMADLGPVILDIYAGMEQTSVRGGWRNEYGFGERAAVRVATGMLVGIAHELWTGIVDASTGLSRPVRLADDRDSRIQGFLEWVF